MTDGAPKSDQSKELTRKKVHFEVKGHSFLVLMSQSTV